jgi:glutamine cyclotransferase
LFAKSVFVHQAINFSLQRFVDKNISAHSAKNTGDTMRNHCLAGIFVGTIVILLIIVPLILLSNNPLGPSTSPEQLQETEEPTTPQQTEEPPSEEPTTSEPTTEPSVDTEPQYYTYNIIKVYPHNETAFTQGLIFEDGVLYEGTGLYGQSTLRRVELETGNTLQLYTLPNQFFGEGITIFDDKIIQLTWKSNKGFVYDKNSFELLQEFTYPTEGWGITHDGNSLIMSDGTATLYFLDPETFTQVRQIEVHDNEIEPVTRLNELEYIQGKVYANIWLEEKIAIINPQNGHVIGWINLDGIQDLENLDANSVLNGIAYDENRDRLFVTGKRWPQLFEVDLVPSE